jgi:CRP-like cAMP-binding protein
MTMEARSGNCVLTRRLHSLRALSDLDVAAINRLCEEPTRNAPAKRDLSRQGDRPRAVLLIKSGWAARYKTLQDGRRQFVAFLIPGDLCDLNNYLVGRMDHSIGALTRVDYVELLHEEIHRLADARPLVAQALWRQLLVGMAVEREWIVNLGQRSAIERLAHLFCEMYYRLDAVGLTYGLKYEFPITQIDLAEATGLTSVHVNRTLQELRAMEVIVLKDRTVEILDLPALESLALFEADYLHLGDMEPRVQTEAPQLRIAE